MVTTVEGVRKSLQSGDIIELGKLEAKSINGAGNRLNLSGIDVRPSEKTEYVAISKRINDGEEVDVDDSEGVIVLGTVHPDGRPTLPSLWYLRPKGGAN